MILRAGRLGGRPGITLTEILIAILIMGIGLVSLATLFPIGLLRLREAQRATRSAYLTQSAQADMAARGLLSKPSFLNPFLSPWYATSTEVGLYPFRSYDPFIQDTPGPYADWAAGGVYRGVGGLGQLGVNQVSLNGLPFIPGPGLPIAYDPLWRFQTNVYLAPGNLEARFGSGIGYIRDNPAPAAGPPSAHGLPRLTNLGPNFGGAILQAFVSPEDVVWQEPDNDNYLMAFNQDDPVTKNLGSRLVVNPSPIVPDLSIATDPLGNPTFSPTVDFRYTWLFTGQQTDSANGAIFDGNIVIIENRPFGIVADPNAPFPGPGGGPAYQVDGERVVEAVFGFSSNVAVAPGQSYGYGIAADRVILLRWPATLPDPDVKVGSWIADVTYERDLTVAATRFPSVPRAGIGSIDNVPAQRCYWYPIIRVTEPTDAVGTLSFEDPVPYRSMLVWSGTDLRARTLMDPNTGRPVVLNAALVSAHVVNVFPRTFTMNEREGR